MRCPAGVADADRAAQGLAAQELGHVVQLADDLALIEGFPAHNGNARRVVAAIFKAAKSGQTDFRRFTRSNVSNNSTHNLKRSGTHYVRRRRRQAQWSLRKWWSVLVDSVAVFF